MKLNLFLNRKADATIQKTAILLFAILYWIIAFTIASNLRPIADEICVLSEWPTNTSLPPFHASPRILGSSFTWLSSLVWSNNYQIAILAHFVLTAFLIGKILSRINILLGENRLPTRRILGTSALVTPWILFALAPNSTALFDSVFWFGGTWHFIGGLIAAYAILVNMDERYSNVGKFGWVIFVSCWSELGAGIMLALAAANIIFLKHLSKKFFIQALIPMAALSIGLLINLTNSRISSVHQGYSSDLIDTLKGSIRMLALYSLNGFLVFLILGVILKSDRNQIIQILRRKFSLILLLANIVIVTMYLIGYPTWRSSATIGILTFASILVVLMNRVPSKSWLRVIIFIITVFMGVNTLNNLSEIQNISHERAIWWKDSSQAESLIRFQIERHEGEISLPADFGSSSWIDTCFLGMKDKGRLRK